MPKTTDGIGDVGGHELALDLDGQRQDACASAVVSGVQRNVEVGHGLEDCPGNGSIVVLVFFKQS